MFLRDCTRHEFRACHFMNISRCYILAVMYLLIVTTVDINDLFCIHIEIVNDTCDRYLDSVIESATMVNIPITQVSGMVILLYFM